MAITPLYTSAELDTLIAAYKLAEMSLASGVAEYTLDVGGSRRTVRKRDLAEVRQALQYYQQQRVQLAAGSGPQTLVGRPAR